MSFLKTFTEQDVGVQIHSNDDESEISLFIQDGSKGTQVFLTRKAANLLHSALQQAFPDLGPMNAEEQADLVAENLQLKDQLKPYLERDRKEEAERAGLTRLELVADQCCPKYDAVMVRNGQITKPLMHPDCANWGWWNGAAVEDHEIAAANQEVRIELKSYVGSGEYDTRELRVPHQWFLLKKDVAIATMQKWFQEETERRAITAAAAEVKAKQDQIKRLQADLAKLSKEVP